MQPTICVVGYDCAVISWEPHHEQDSTVNPRQIHYRLKTSTIPYLNDWPFVSRSGQCQLILTVIQNTWKQLYSTW